MKKTWKLINSKLVVYHTVFLFRILLEDILVQTCHLVLFPSAPHTIMVWISQPKPENILQLSKWLQSGNTVTNRRTKSHHLSKGWFRKNLTEHKYAQFLSDVNSYSNLVGHFSNGLFVLIMKMPFIFFLAKNSYETLQTPRREQKDTNYSEFISFC